jgi:hypothetical protein
MERHTLGDSRQKATKRAVTHILREIERIRVERDAAAVRMARSIETFDLLIGSLPADQRLAYRKRLQEITSEAPSENRGNEAYGNIVALFKDDPRQVWSISDIFTALGKTAKPPEPKAVYNAVNYLEKSGRLIRLDRGRYFVRDWGAGDAAGEDLEGDGVLADRVR